MKFVRQQDVPWTEGAGYRKRILLREGALNAPGTLVQIDGKTTALQAGDTLTCELGEVHNTSNPKDAPFTYVVLKTNVVDNDLFWDCAED